MSLSLAERLSVTLEPHRVLVGRRVVDADPAYGTEAWHGAIAALQQEISTLRRRTDFTVILSNHFVRYAIVPRQNGAASADEELALARFHFARIHGERAKAWEVRLSGELACAIDLSLLKALKDCFSKKARLISVQPYLMHAYNQWRPRIPREGAWLVLAEPERVCLARLAPRGWASVHNAREADWRQALERERSRASGEHLPSLVLRDQR